jgi:hypothetical protein
MNFCGYEFREILLELSLTFHPPLDFMETVWDLTGAGVLQFDIQHRNGKLVQDSVFLPGRARKHDSGKLFVIALLSALFKTEGTWKPTLSTLRPKSGEKL